MSSSAVFVQKIPHWTMERKAEDEVIFNGKAYHFFDLLRWDAVEDFGLAATISANRNLIDGQNSQENDEVMSVHSFFKSLSQASGQITTKITNPLFVAKLAAFSQMIPWQIRVNLHTLRISCKTLRDSIEIGEVSPRKRVFRLAKDMKNPLLIELVLDLPSKSVCEISADYETAFLKITSFPADANSGVYVPGPIVTFWTNANSSQTDGNAYGGGGEEEVWRLHGEPLLILLPVPDFSMPFNVICLVCTSIAIFYGNVITMTTKLMKPILKKTDAKDSPSKLRQKLLKILESLRNLLKKEKSSKSKAE